jgi:hypothetical protein
MRAGGSASTIAELTSSSGPTWSSSPDSSAGHQKAGPSPWLRQIGRGRAVLIYRDLPPAMVRAPGWFEDPRSAAYARLLATRGLAAMPST